MNPVIISFPYNLVDQLSAGAFGSPDMYLAVFSDDRRYIRETAKLLQEMWDKAVEKAEMGHVEPGALKVYFQHEAMTWFAMRNHTGVAGMDIAFDAMVWDAFLNGGLQWEIRSTKDDRWEVLVAYCRDGAWDAGKVILDATRHLHFTLGEAV